MNPVTPAANAFVNRDTKESNVTNAKADTTKVVVLANLAFVTPTEVKMNPVTPVANVSAKKDSLQKSVIRKVWSHFTKSNTLHF